MSGCAPVRPFPPFTTLQHPSQQVWNSMSSMEYEGKLGFIPNTSTEATSTANLILLDRLLFF